jgi:hypothetical protein
MRRTLRSIRLLIFFFVFVGPLLAAPFHTRTEASIEAMSFGVCGGTAPCGVPCTWSGCCDFCARRSYELSFFCTFPCWIGDDLCCYNPG